ncbi:RloB family protein [Candidatus Poriferisocius sp.]|uniref:RloB family protein n=1 Tax=Candidatus Poriferisocius sp. TaxID=3101276 RepID=UPI003B02E9A5
MARSSRGKKGKDKSLRRKIATRSPKRTVRAFCEGKRTEVDYLKALRRQPEVRDIASVAIEIDETVAGFDPLALVRKAAAAQKDAKDEMSEIDEVWCIFDVEQPKRHSRLNDAVALARERGIQVAVSNPCFELWLMLHFQEQSAWLDTNDAKHQLKQHDGNEGKGLDGAMYMPRRDEAARRARRLLIYWLGKGSRFGLGWARLGVGSVSFFV